MSDDDGKAWRPVSSLSKGRTTILIMEINPDGSLSGNWLRRTDRSDKGTEAWKK